MNTLPILYSFRRCPYAMRARLAINVSGMKVELREILLRDKPIQMLEISPKGTVPVLIEPDGNVVEESLDIMDWALAINDPQDWLKPEKGSLAEMRQLIKQCDEEFKPRLDLYKYASRYDDIDGEIERDKASDFLWQLDKMLETQSHLFGNRATFADMAIITFIRQFANVDRNWFDGCKWGNLQRWLVAFLEGEQFSQIMNKYNQWHEGDALVEFGLESAKLDSL